jgi:hypothetical protein
VGAEAWIEVGVANAIGDVSVDGLGLALVIIYWCPGKDFLGPSVEMMTEELIQEALIVGAANVVALFLFRRLAPDSPMLQAFAAGVAIHLTAEYTGVNEAYCWRKDMQGKRKTSTLKKDYDKKRCPLLDTSSSSGVSLLLSVE